MRHHLVGSVGRAVIGLLIAVQATLAGPAGPAGPIQPVMAASHGYSIDVARRGDFVAQTNFVQCVGASMQMMLNVIGKADDQSARTQLRLQKLARSLSGPTRQGFIRQGASVRGWMNGLNRLAAGPYRLEGLDTLQEAMRTAALAIRVTGKPVGLLMWHGRHAWVMSGFKASADPLHSANFRVTAAVVMDPLYPYGSKTWGPSPSPRQVLAVARLGRQFVPRNQRPWPGAVGVAAGASLASLAGKYVLVLPYVREPVGRFVQRPS
jgi:hypothetical protein